MNAHNKLECFSLASPSSQVNCLQARPEPTWVKHLKSAPLFGRLLVLPINTCTSLNKIAEDKHYSLLWSFANYGCKKCFIILPPGLSWFAGWDWETGKPGFNIIKLFSFVIDSPVTAGKSYWRGRLSTVDLLVLNSLDQFLFTLKILLTFLQNKLT
jgi:hypothetical protein